MFQNSLDSASLKNDIVTQHIQNTNLNKQINGRCISLAEVACRFLYLAHTVINDFEDSDLVIVFLVQSIQIIFTIYSQF